MTEQTVNVERIEEVANLFGSFDENIRALENEFHVTVVNRGTELTVSGEAEDVMLAVRAAEACAVYIRDGADRAMSRFN